MDLNPLYQVGDKHKDFRFTKALVISELEAVLYELQHEPTGAKVMHIHCDDPENLFSLSFQTIPTDSTGAPHILEHIVLCGSKKFPVNDPFFSMSRRSLNTFMNAMTGSDFTCYPAASQVEKDFYNLLEVYLDAVFCPELKEMSFLQEGHRFEFSKPDDPNSPLIYKGVVFNEMKGSLSNPETRLWQSLLSKLTPDLTYFYNSGGDPKEIPNLTNEELKAFHSKFYHPSRCIFFFYGALPTTRHLDFIAKNALKDVKKVEPLPPLPLQKRFEKPQAFEETYPLQDPKLDSRTYLSFAWLTTHISNEEEALALSVLDSILMENDASPLKLSLLESGLCAQVNGYLDTEMSEIPYVLICAGCEKSSQKKLKTLLFETLEKIAEEGIDPKLIDAAIHQLEFNRLEITHTHGPFGLTLFMRSVLPWQHGCAPENSLTLYSHFERLQEAAKDPQFFPNLIRKYLIKNPHFVAHVFSPNAKLEEKERAEEQSKLKACEAKLSDQEKEQIVEQAKALKRFQEQEKSKSNECLPKITLGEVPKEVKDYFLTLSQEDQLTIFHHECFTNHIIYADLCFDLPAIEKEELPYLQLLISLLPDLGAGERDYKANLEYIHSYLGGFHTTLHLHPQLNNPNELQPTFGLRGKALSRNTDKLMNLFKEVVLKPRIDDPERIKTLILQLHTELENQFNRHALSYAIQEAVSGFTLPGYLNAQLGGLSYFAFIKGLVKELDTKLPEITQKLKTLYDKLAHYNHPHLILSCDHAQYGKLANENFYDLGALPSKPYQEWQPLSIEPPQSPQGRVIASPVSFSALGYKTAGGMPSDAAALSLSTTLIENTYLHQAIREQGGAYGCGANYNPITGHYSFYTYRDPHIKQSFVECQNGIKSVADGNFTPQEMEEAKLSLIQDLDAPISPGSRAISAYHLFREQRTKEVRQTFRDELLMLKKKSISAALAENLIPELDQGIAVTFAGEDLLRKEDPTIPILPIDS